MDEAVAGTKTQQSKDEDVVSSSVETLTLEDIEVFRKLDMLKEKHDTNYHTPGGFFRVERPKLRSQATR